MKNNVFLKTLLFASLACIVGSSNAQTSSEATSTISRMFYNSDGTPLEGVRVTVTKVVKNGRIISLGPVTYVSNASGVVSIKVPQGSTVYMETPEFNTPGGVHVNVTSPSGWTYTYDSLQPLSTMSATGLIVQRDDVTAGSTPKNTLDFSTTFNVSASPDTEANVSINHDSLKGRAGSKLTYLHNLFVDRGLSAHDETSLANAHTKALDSNFVLLIPPDYPAAAMTFTNRDSALRLINYATINITENDTVPAGASIVMAGKGRFNISSGKTLTFASGSRFDGGKQRRFIGAGSVKFQEGSVDAVYPEWWGAVADSSTLSDAAINSALASGVKRHRVKFQPGVYRIDDRIQVPSNVEVIGANTCIVQTDTTDRAFQLNPTPIAGIAKNIKISGFTIRYVPRPKAKQDTLSFPGMSGIYAHEVDTLEISNNRILGAKGMGITVVASRNVKIFNNHVENTLWDGIHVANGDNTPRGRLVWSENVIITGNTVKNAGDDKIACVSYRREPDFLISKYPIWEDTTGGQLINKNFVISNNIVEGGNASANARGIAIIGGQQVVVDGNTVRGFTGGKMTSGILIDRTFPLDGFRNLNVVVSNNTVVDGQYTTFVDNFGGIKIGAVDSLIVTGNFINWTHHTYGIRVHGDTVGNAYGFTNEVREALILDNIIQDSRIGISMLTKAATWHQGIVIRGNIIANSRRAAIEADSIQNIYIEGNRLINVNTSGTGSIAAIDLARVDLDVVVRDNMIRSSTSCAWGASFDNAKSTADIREQDNVFNLATTTANLQIININSAAKTMFRDSKRIHYATGVPTNRTWEKGDITINKDPDSGENSMWICTVAGNPGTWVQSTAPINGLGVNDTTGVVLTAAGIATITGISNIILDTFGSATLDTLVTLNGRIGQVVYISPRSNARNIVILDGNNFRLPQASIRLDSTEDVLEMKATTATSWKVVNFRSRRDLRGSNSFSGMAATDTVTVATGLSTDLYFIQLTGAAAPSANDMHRVEARNGSFVVHRSGSGTSGLTYNWQRLRK